MPQAPIKDHDTDLFDPLKAPKPSNVWYNWWNMHRPMGHMYTGEWIGPGPKCQEQREYATKDHAETAAQDWIAAHEECQCFCGFGPHCYIGAYEEGKEP